VEGDDVSVSRNSATRIGLIGAGFIAGQHADILAGWSDVAVVAVADPVEPRSRELAARYGAQPFASHVELLEDCEVDALFICVPPYARGAPELAAVDRGLPFFVEKPLAADLETAERTAEVVAGAGVATAAGYHWRYLETTRRAQEVLAGCRARLVLGYWFDTTPPVAWWSQAALSGGQMVEQTTHLLDLARYLVGEVEEVYGASAPAAAGVSPVSATILHFASGALGSFAATCVLNHKFGAGLQILCDGLAMELSEFDLRAESGYGEPLIELCSNAAERNGIRRAAMALQDRAFLDAVQGKPNRVRVTYEEALRTHRLAIAVTRSAVLGQRLPVCATDD
jgi:predicted dehydrogenase